MSVVKNLPEVMRHAREDLSANVTGQFSPDDWAHIFATAHEKFLARQSEGLEDLRAWEQVMLDFYHNHYWGFQPNYRATRDPQRKSNFGLRLIVLTVVSMTSTKMALAWLGQRYTASDEPRDAYIFFAVLALVVAGFAHFLWRTRHYEEK
jgi:hypothetical protein